MTRAKPVAMMLAAVAAVGLFARTACADSAPVTAPTNAISVNPLSLIVGLFQVNFEHKLNAKSSLLASGNYWSLSFGNYEWTAFGAGLGYRMYFKPVAPDGFYWEPRADFAVVSLTLDDPFWGTAEASGFSFGPAVLVGRQWVWEGGFLIDLGIGLNFFIGEVEASSGPVTVSADLSGVGFAGRFALGYAWK